MPTTNYDLHNYAVDGGTVSAERMSKPARVVDRAMHYGLTLLPDGRKSGALIATTKRIVFPGEGMIDGCAWAISATDEETGTCQAGSSDTQIKDTANLTQADDFWIDAWVFAESGSNNGEYRQVTAFNQASGTLTVGSAFSAAFSAGDSYRVTFVAIKPDTLTNSVVNYVFGRRVTYATQVWSTEETGHIEFHAKTVATKTAGEILLGTITLDGAGVATAVDNDISSAVDTCHPLDIRELRGTSAITGLAAGANTTFFITFDDAIMLGPFTAFSSDNANVTLEMLAVWENDRFQVRATNSDAYAADATITWRRFVIIN